MASDVTEQPPADPPAAAPGRRLPRGALVALVPAVALILAIVGSRLAGDDEDAAPPSSAGTSSTTAATAGTTLPAETTTTTEAAVTEEPAPTTIPPETGTRKIQGLEAGDCFNRPPDDTATEIVLLECDQPHTDEVYTVLTLRGSRYPANIDDQAEDGCYNAFVTFLGTDPEDTPFAYDWYTPTRAEWGQGARRVPCVITDPEDRPLTGSAADAGR